MKLEQIVVSLELAKQLKKAGYPQKTLFAWGNDSELNEYTVLDTKRSIDGFIKRFRRGITNAK